MLAVWLRPLVDYLERTGFDSRAVFARSGVDVGQVFVPGARLPLALVRLRQIILRPAEQRYEHRANKKKEIFILVHGEYKGQQYTQYPDDPHHCIGFDFPGNVHHRAGCGIYVRKIGCDGGKHHQQECGKGKADFSQLQLEEQEVADLAASFQEAVADCLVDKVLAALRRTGLNTLCVGGGVAAGGVVVSGVVVGERHHIELDATGLPGSDEVGPPFE